MEEDSTPKGEFSFSSEEDSKRAKALAELEKELAEAKKQLAAAEKKLAERKMDVAPAYKSQTSSEEDASPLRKSPMPPEEVPTRSKEPSVSSEEKSMPSKGRSVPTRFFGYVKPILHSCLGVFNANSSREIPTDNTQDFVLRKDLHCQNLNPSTTLENPQTEILTSTLKGPKAGKPPRFYLLSELSEAVYSEMKLSPLDLLDPERIFCVKCQRFHRGRGSKRDNENCSGFLIRDAHAKQDILVLSDAVKFRWELLYLIMRFYRESTTRGISIDALRAEHNEKRWHHSISARIIHDRLYLNILSDAKVMIDNAQLAFWVAIGCKHSKPLNLFRACESMLVAYIKNDPTEADTQEQSDLHRCPRCPSEYRIRISGNRVSSQYKVSISFYIDAGECIHLREREWCALTGYDDSTKDDPFSRACQTI